MPSLIERHYLLKDGYKYLSYKQLFTLLWWEIGGNLKKARLFYKGLKEGKSFNFAFIDEKKYKQKEYLREITS